MFIKSLLLHTIILILIVLYSLINKYSERKITHVDEQIKVSLVDTQQIPIFNKKIYIRDNYKYKIKDTINNSSESQNNIVTMDIHEISEILQEGYNKAIIYPINAVLNNQEGIIIILIHINKNGIVSSVVVEKSSNFLLLDEEVINTVSEWKFDTVKMHNKSGLIIRLPVSFSLS